MWFIPGLGRQPYDFRAFEPILETHAQKLGLPGAVKLRSAAEIAANPFPRFAAAQAKLAKESRPFGDQTEAWIRHSTTWKIGKPDPTQAGISPKQPALGTIPKGTVTPDGKVVGQDAKIPSGFTDDGKGNWTLKANFKMLTAKFPAAEMQNYHESELDHALGIPSELIVRCMDEHGTAVPLDVPDAKGVVQKRTGYLKLELFDKDKGALPRSPAEWDSDPSDMRLQAVLTRAAMRPFGDFDEKDQQYKLATVKLPDGTKVHTAVFADNDHFLGGFTKASLTAPYDRQAKFGASPIPSAHALAFARHVRGELFISDEHFAVMQHAAERLATLPPAVVEAHVLPVLTELIRNGKLKDYSVADAKQNPAAVTAKAQEALGDFKTLLGRHPEKMRALIAQVKSDRALATSSRLTSFGIGMTKPERARVRAMRHGDNQILLGEEFLNSKLYTFLIQATRKLTRAE